MIVAYMMPNDADLPRDGLGFITIGFTSEGALRRLEEQFRKAQKEAADEEDDFEIEWNVGIAGERDHAIVKWGTETTELYWVHTAED